MKDAIRPFDEEERLEALHKLNILTGDSEERFDRITRIAQRMFGVPIAEFSLIDADHQIIKSSYGLDISSIERDVSLANYSLITNDIFVVPDTLKDDRFSGNPLVVSQPKIRFFSSISIRSKSGYRIGALSIADREPRSMSAHDQSVFRDLAEMIENELSFMEVASFDRHTQMSINDGFFNLAEQSLLVCEREKNHAVALVFDVKNVLSSNDTLSQTDNDKHVRVFAEQMRHLFRKSDVVGRLGSEEFTALLLNARSEHVNEIVRKLQSSIDVYNRDAGNRSHVAFNHGSAEFDPDHPVSSNALIKMANIALNGLAKAV